MTETEELAHRASEAETMRQDGHSNPSTADVLRAQRDAAEAVIIRLVEHIDRVGGNGVSALISARDAVEAELTEATLTTEQLPSRRPMHPIEAMVTGMNKAYAAMHTPPDTHAECHEAAVADIVGVK